MPLAATKARPAQFAPDPQRRVLIAKIHVAKKEMGLVDDDYRQMLLDVTGWVSSADCTVPELRAMVEAMKAKGFQPKKASKPGADHPFAAKARALWISLYHLGAIANSSEQALEAFACRQLGCMKMQWANQAQAYKLVEALKAIAQRHGWDQHIRSTFGKRPVPADVALRILKVRLVERICQRLEEQGIMPWNWSPTDAAERLAGMKRDEIIDRWDLGDLDLLAKALGEKLREAAR